MYMFCRPHRDTPRSKRSDPQPISVSLRPQPARQSRSSSPSFHLLFQFRVHPLACRADCAGWHVVQISCVAIGPIFSRGGPAHGHTSISTRRANVPFLERSSGIASPSNPAKIAHYSTSRSSVTLIACSPVLIFPHGREHAQSKNFERRRADDPVVQDTHRPASSPMPAAPNMLTIVLRISDFAFSRKSSPRMSQRMPIESH